MNIFGLSSLVISLIFISASLSSAKPNTVVNQQPDVTKRSTNLKLNFEIKTSLLMNIIKKIDKINRKLDGLLIRTVAQTKGVLRGHVAERFSVLSLLECQLNCVRLLPKCKSFNYKEKRNNSNVCEINTGRKDFAHVQEFKFVKDGESIYGEVINTTGKAEVPVIQDVCERRNTASDITMSLVANTITYLQATSTCHTKGKELCNAKQICCNETIPFNGVQSGDKWVPVSDSDNEWIQIGQRPHKPCLLHSKLGAKPAWGTKAVAYGFKKYLFCCNPCMI